MLTAFGLVSAQNDAFIGKDDLRLNLGANFQKYATGIHTSLDYGLGDSFSIGAQAGYLLGAKENAQGEKPETKHRFDAKLRASAHLGDVIGLASNIDVYPGLNIGLKNFGGHAGARVFFNKGFGLFVETQFPIARYNTDAADFQLLNNRFAFIAGATFDLTK